MIHYSTTVPWWIWYPMCGIVGSWVAMLLKPLFKFIHEWNHPVEGPTEEEIQWFIAAYRKDYDC